MIHVETTSPRIRAVSVPFARYSCLTQIYRALCGDAQIVHLQGHQHGVCKATEASVVQFCHWNEKLLLYSSGHIVIIILLAEELLLLLNVQLAKG